MFVLVLSQVGGERINLTLIPLFPSFYPYPIPPSLSITNIRRWPIHIHPTRSTQPHTPVYSNNTLQS